MNFSMYICAFSSTSKILQCPVPYTFVNIFYFCLIILSILSYLLLKIS